MIFLTLHKISAPILHFYKLTMDAYRLLLISLDNGKCPRILTILHDEPRDGLLVLAIDLRGFDELIGKKIYSIKTTTPRISIPLADFYRGVYIFQLLDRSNKIIESGKFQVIK